MSKYLESVCLWEENEKYLFSFEGFYVKCACKKRQPQWQRGVRDEKCVYSPGEGNAGDCGLGAALSSHRPCTDPQLEGTCRLRLG